jgi:hypothetical protein
LSPLKLARLTRTASVIRGAVAAQFATAYAFVHLKILGVFAIQVLRRVHATRTPSAIVHRELNAFVSVHVPAKLFPPACVIQVLRARVTPVQRARVVLVPPVPVRGCALVTWDPIAIVVQKLIVTAGWAPIVCAVLALYVRVQDCVPVPLARSVHAMQARHVLVSQVRPVPAV